MIEPFDDASVHQNTRLDHISLQLPREENGPYIPLSYRRLLLSGRFPDGTFALISVLDRCYDIEIDGLPDEDLHSMPAELAMDSHPVQLMYEQPTRE